MKKMFLAMVLAFVMAFGVVPAFAGGDGDVDVNQTQQQGIGNNNTANGAGGTVSVFSPSGGSATIQPGAIVNSQVGGTFSPTFNPIVTNKDIGNVNIGGGFLSSTLSPSADANAEANQKQKQQQGQIQGQQQGQNNNQVISPEQNNNQNNKQNNKQNNTQKTDILIEAPKQALLGVPMVGVAELNFGAGKVDWNFATSLPRIGIPELKPSEVVKEVLESTCNVKFKNYLSTALKMKKAQMPLGYNVRLIVVKAEAQKSWTTGGALSGGGSGINNAGIGSAAGGSLVPSFGGTKADDLYTIIIVKIN